MKKILNDVINENLHDLDISNLIIEEEAPIVSSNNPIRKVILPHSKLTESKDELLNNEEEDKVTELINRLHDLQDTIKHSVGDEIISINARIDELNNEIHHRVDSIDDDKLYYNISDVLSDLEYALKMSDYEKEAPEEEVVEGEKLVGAENYEPPKKLVIEDEEAKKVLEDVFGVTDLESLIKFAEGKYGELSVEATNGALAYSRDEGEYIISFKIDGDTVIITGSKFYPEDNLNEEVAYSDYGLSCPKCGSKKYHTIDDEETDYTKTYHHECEDCGYVGDSGEIDLDDLDESDGMVYTVYGGNEGVNSYIDAYSSEDEAKAKVAELKDKGINASYVAHDTSNLVKEEPIDVSKYDTKEKIEKRLKDITAQKRYISKRDRVSCAFGSDQEQYDLERERKALKAKLKDLKEDESTDNLYFFSAPEAYWINNEVNDEEKIDDSRMEADREYYQKRFPKLYLRKPWKDEDNYYIDFIGTNKEDIYNAVAALNWYVGRKDECMKYNILPISQLEKPLADDEKKEIADYFNMDNLNESYVLQEREYYQLPDDLQAIVDGFPTDVNDPMYDNGYEVPDELLDISNNPPTNMRIKDWMRIEAPFEYQLEDIPEDVTFEDLKDYYDRNGVISMKLIGNIDSDPRNRIINKFADIFEIDNARDIELTEDIDTSMNGDMSRGINYESPNSLLKKYNFQSNDDKFYYSMLGRLQSDCKYVLGAAEGDLNQLWVKNDPVTHCALMREIYNILPEKPDWITLDDIDTYEREMLKYRKTDESDEVNVEEIKDDPQMEIYEMLVNGKKEGLDREANIAATKEAINDPTMDDYIEKKADEIYMIVDQTDDNGNDDPSDGLGEREDVDSTRKTTNEHLNKILSIINDEGSIDPDVLRYNLESAIEEFSEDNGVDSEGVKNAIDDVLSMLDDEGSIDSEILKNVIGDILSMINNNDNMNEANDVKKLIQKGNTFIPVRDGETDKEALDNYEKTTVQDNDDHAISFKMPRYPESLKARIMSDRDEVLKNYNPKNVNPDEVSRKIQNDEELTDDEAIWFMSQEPKKGDVILSDKVRKVASDGNWVDIDKYDAYEKDPEANQDALEVDDEDIDLEKASKEIGDLIRRLEAKRDGLDEADDIKKMVRQGNTFIPVRDGEDEDEVLANYNKREKDADKANEPFKGPQLRSPEMRAKLFDLFANHKDELMKMYDPSKIDREEIYNKVKNSIGLDMNEYLWYISGPHVGDTVLSGDGEYKLASDGNLVKPDRFEAYEKDPAANQDAIEPEDEGMTSEELEAASKDIRQTLDNLGVTDERMKEIADDLGLSKEERAMAGIDE